MYIYICMLYSVLYVVYGIENIWKYSISVYRILYTAVYFIDCLARELRFTRKPNDSASSNCVARFTIINDSGSKPRTQWCSSQAKKQTNHVFFCTSIINITMIYIIQYQYHHHNWDMLIIYEASGLIPNWVYQLRGLLGVFMPVRGCVSGNVVEKGSKLPEKSWWENVCKAVERIRIVFPVVVSTCSDKHISNLPDFLLSCITSFTIYHHVLIG